MFGEEDPSDDYVRRCTPFIVAAVGPHLPQIRRLPCHRKHMTGDEVDSEELNGERNDRRHNISTVRQTAGVWFT